MTWDQAIHPVTVFWLSMPKDAKIAVIVIGGLVLFKLFDWLTD